MFSVCAMKMSSNIIHLLSLTMGLLILPINSKPMEEQHPSFNDVLHPYMVQFIDLTKNNGEDATKPSTTIITKQDFDLPSSFIKFSQVRSEEKLLEPEEAVAQSTATTITEKKNLTSTRLKSEVTPTGNVSSTAVNDTTGSTLSSTSTTVPPVREKGILDILFPPQRVKNFKLAFDLIRRILSYTF